MGLLNISLATVNQTPLAWADNFQRIIKAVQLAKEQRAHLLCLPELALSGYGCADFFLHPWFLKKCARYLAQVLPHTQDLTLAIGLPWVHHHRCYNVLALVKDTQLIGFYAKQRLAHTGVYYEGRWFSAWPRGVVESTPWDGQEVPIGEVYAGVSDLRVGFEICEDAWQGTVSSSELRYEGKDIHIILNASASHFEVGKIRRVQRMIKARSQQYNGVYGYANLAGNEAGRLLYDGALMLAQKGYLISCAQRFPFEDLRVLTASINPTIPIQIPRPSLRVSAEPGRRYEEFLAMSSVGLYDYLRKSGSRGFVVSLSGGADSSLCALLVAEMIKRSVQALGIATFVESLGLASPPRRPGPTEAHIKALTHELLWCVYQEGAHSTQETLQSAKALSNELGAHFLCWGIDDVSDAYQKKVERALGRSFRWKEDDSVLQNIQARSRVPALWMLANATNALLLNTGNRSEACVGYTTMDGDTAGSLAPLAGVSKSFILHFLRWAEKRLPCPALSRVCALPPSAELRPGQSDEADLMPYEHIQHIEKAFVEERKAPGVIMKELSQAHGLAPMHAKAHVRKFFALWRRSQWKRERMAPGLHTDSGSVDPKTFARFPILFGAPRHDPQRRGS